VDIFSENKTEVKDLMNDHLESVVTDQVWNITGKFKNVNKFTIHTKELFELIFFSCKI
jgi:predicted RNase H-like nuclease